MNFSKVMLIGVLTCDPETRTLATDRAMTRLGIAVTRKFKDSRGHVQEETTFLNVVAYGKSAETLARYGKKGTRLFVDGRLSARTVQNDRGESRTFHDIVVEGFQFLDGGKTSAEKPADGEEALDEVEE